MWSLGKQTKFLSEIDERTLPREGFQRWLVQDYLFAKGLTTFQAITAAKTPRPSQKLVIAGLTAMDREMGRFEEHAAKESLDLNVPPHPVCCRYVEFLIASAYSHTFEVLLAMLYDSDIWSG